MWQVKPATPIAIIIIIINDITMTLQRTTYVTTSQCCVVCECEFSSHCWTKGRGSRCKVMTTLMMMITMVNGHGDDDDGDDNDNVLIMMLMMIVTTMLKYAVAGDLYEKKACLTFILILSLNQD